jgi:two-component system CheB/CheR fusion protein
LSDEPFWTFFSALPVGAVLFDPEADGFVAFNDAACAQLGYTRDAFARLGIGDIDAMRSSAELLQARRQLKLNSAPQRFHTRQRAADGSSREVDVTLQSIVLAGKTLGYSVWHDVTDREDAIEKLRAREKELARVQRIGRIGGFEVDLQHGFVSHQSPEYLRLHDLAENATSESHEGWIQRLHPEDRERMVRHFRDSIAGTLRDYAAEYRVVTPAGDIRWISSLAEIERAADGRPLRMIGAHIDVSALRNAETELASHAARLEEADRRKDEFLAMLGHELRNPLAPILSVCDWLRSKAPDLAPDVVAAHDVIDRQARHLRVLVDELLDVARINTGRIALKCETVDLGDVVLAAVEQVRDLMSRQRHRFELALAQPPEPSDRIHVRGDLARLIQVVSNLLNNAAKYTDPGGIVKLAVTTEDNEARVLVQDSGVGIPAESLPQIFDPFAKGARQSHPARDGLGVGLSLAHRITQLHGGRLWAHSDGPGKGSCFTVALPRVHPPVVAVTSSTAVAPSRPAAACRVLIVDDNIDAAESMAVLLQMDGHDTRVLHDGKDIVEQALEYRPDVVLLDIGLPGRDGFDLAGDLRRAPELVGLRLIAVTGYGQEDDRRRAQESGFDQHLIKPVDYSKLKTLLRAPQASVQA